MISRRTSSSPAPRSSCSSASWRSLDLGGALRLGRDRDRRGRSAPHRRRGRRLGCGPADRCSRSGALHGHRAQCGMLAAPGAPVFAIAAAAVLAGLPSPTAPSSGTPRSSRQSRADKISRVSAYNWMGAMIFLPAGYAIAGPVADRIGISTSLWIGAAWIVVTTIARPVGAERPELPVQAQTMGQRRRITPR